MALENFKIADMSILVIFVIFFGHNSHAKDLYASSKAFSDHFHHYPSLVPLNNNLSLTVNTNKTVDLKELQRIDSKYASCGKVKDIRERTIPEFQHFFVTKQLSIFQLCACYIHRIEKMNPFLNAVIEINPEVLKQALILDYDRFLGRGGHMYGALYGIPILIKDNIATADSMKTCSGSLALIGCKPHRDASIVTQIKKNGGVILGKTNLSEFAKSADLPNGWSGRGGQTHNCYSRSTDPEGSSTGSAVATAANLCAFAIGTETDGSIVEPSERASAVGLKTSRGKIPGDGIIPISAETQDVAGPITRTVEDAEIFMKIFEHYGCEPVYRSNNENQDVHHPYKPQRRFRVGVLRDYFWESKNATQIKKINVLSQTLIKFGNSERIELVDPVTAPKGAREAVSGDKESTTLLHEFKDGVNKYLKTCSFHNNNDGHYGHNNQSQPMTLRDVIRYNQKHPVPEGYGQTLLLKSEATDGIHNVTYLKARRENVQAARHFLDSALKNVDVIAAPITDVDNDTSLYGYGAIAGYPYITVPAGFMNTYQPVGITFLGSMCSEWTLLEIAKIFEAGTYGRRPPFFSP